MTPVALSDVICFCRLFLTSLGPSRIVKFVVCAESSSRVFVSSAHVSALRSVFTVFSRYESMLYTGNQYVIVLRLCFPCQSSYDRLISKRGCSLLFGRHRRQSLAEVFSCVSVRFSLLIEFEAPGVIVGSDGSLCISWSVDSSYSFS